MATAFAPPHYYVNTARGAGSVSRRWASLPSGFPLFSHGYASVRPAPFAFTSSSRARRYLRPSQSTQTRLRSTIPDSNDLATAGDSIIEIEESDPYSDQAKDKLAKFFEQNDIDSDVDSAHDSLLRLTEQVLSWNRRLNLVSRKDCTAPVVYHRHVLPSVALLPLVLDARRNDDDGATLNIVDVGTGGGFPGLPLALLLPDARFTLVDSVQKKLVAVSEIAAELDVSNVRVHWGRAEEMYVGEKGRREHRGRYDVVLGRSVTALPRFCAWVSDLLRRHDSDDDDRDEEGRGGRLIYIIGGELDELVESRIARELPLDEALRREEGTSDKRALVFHTRDVEEIATESGEKGRIVRSGPGRKNKKQNNRGGGKKMARGAWSKKQNDVKKQRGYDDFQRYEF